MSVFPPSNLVVRNGRFQSPWVYVSPGPAALGVVSEFSDLLSASWLLLVSDRERELQLWQLVGDVWERVLVEEHPLIDSVIPAGSERFSLSFDNDGRVVVAYELNDGVHVWLWDDGWVETIFSGVDPIVVNSAFWTEDLSGDAVLVFFLPVSRDGRVLARWSGDGFVGVEGLVGIDFLVGVGGDVRGIDRVQVIGYKRYQVWVRGVDGELLGALVRSIDMDVGGDDWGLSVGSMGADIIQIFQPVISERSRFPEFFIAMGPDEVAEPGSGSIDELVSTVWILFLDRNTRVLHLLRETVEPGEWDYVDVPGHPLIGEVSGSDVRRVSLAFDQAAQPVVALERAGVVTVTRWDPVEEEFVDDVSFFGVDPVIALDATWSFDVGGSDVIVFYLAADRLSVRYRLQRDVVSVEYALESFGDEVVLDRVIAGDWQYSLLMGWVDGEGFALDSERYPPNITVMDAVGVSATGPVSGDYLSVVIEQEFDDGVAVMATGPASGAYTEPVFEGEYADGIAVGGAGPASGDYVYVILDEGGDDAIAVSGAGPNSGEYRYVIIDAVDEQEGIAVSATGPAGGTYEAV